MAIRVVIGCLICALEGLISTSAAPAIAAAASEYQLFARTNLVAWCIVPFDAAKRGPEARADMLRRLGFEMFAYDYRAEHIPSFDAELGALRKQNVRLIAWWFPTSLNSEGRLILDTLKRHNVRAQLWVTGGGATAKNAEAQTALGESEAKRIGTIARAAQEAGCTVALYNHGGWFGEPENQIAIIDRLRGDGVTNVGIVYNLHHGHEHLARFPALMKQMKPHLVALNLNGMVKEGDKVGKKILPIGQGDLDLQLLKSIEASGWRGPVGILNHTDEDAEGRLRDNVEGLNWLVGQLRGKNPGPKPKPKTWQEPAPSTSPSLK